MRCKQRDQRAILQETLKLLALGFAFVAGLGQSFGDLVSFSEAGINSQGLGLTGDLVSVGQVEQRRPGEHMFDSASNISTIVDPWEVFTINGMPHVDFTSEHGASVAGVLIATALGVAPDAHLYSATASHPSNPPSSDDEILAWQHVAQQSGDEVAAINYSASVGPLPLDGLSNVTLKAAWVARVFDVLMVIARGNSGVTCPPGDLFNGLNVVASQQDANGFTPLHPIGINSGGA